LKNSFPYLVVLSFLTIYIVWGSTYLAVAIGLEQIPAFQICSIRYIIAGCISLVLYQIFAPSKKTNKLELKNAIKAGFTFLGLGTGGVAWSLNFIDTGMAALIIAAAPLIIVILMWIINKTRPSNQTFAGVFIGLIGMFLLINQDSLMSDSRNWLGIVIIFLSIFAWGLGSIFVSKAELPKSQFLNSGIQMVTGGIFTIFVSILLGEKGASPIAYTINTWLSLAFLILFGSLAGFTAFNYLLKKVSPEKVATNTYVNPVIAMILGYYFRDEIISNQSVAAAVVLLFGVFIVNTTRRKSLTKKAIIKA
jgi:drug/metabolite transporter (DMT)-like permease